MSEHERELWANDLRDKYGIGEPESDDTTIEDEDYLVPYGDEIEF